MSVRSVLAPTRAHRWAWVAFLGLNAADKFGSYAALRTGKVVEAGTGVNAWAAHLGYFWAFTAAFFFSIGLALVLFGVTALPMVREHVSESTARLFTLVALIGFAGFLGAVVASNVLVYFGVGIL